MKFRIGKTKAPEVKKKVVIPEEKIEKVQVSKEHKLVRLDSLRGLSKSKGRITTPGRFLGERLYVPYLFGLWQRGFGAEDAVDGVLRIKILPEYCKPFPELVGKKEVVLMLCENLSVTEVEEGSV